MLNCIFNILPYFRLKKIQDKKKVIRDKKAKAAKAKAAELPETYNEGVANLLDDDKDEDVLF